MLMKIVLILTTLALFGVKSEVIELGFHEEPIKDHFSLAESLPFKSKFS